VERVAYVESNTRKRLLGRGIFEKDGTIYYRCDDGNIFGADY
jgi:hypothetical protein